MRLIQIRLPDEQLETATDVLDEEGVDYVRQRIWTNGDEKWLVELPVPTDAIGHLLGRLESEGVDVDQYTTVMSLESAMTPQTELLQERFADDFDPLTRPELRSKARDMSRDTRSFLAMIFLSSIIAVAGLLIESPAVVVGSMVIAPIVGPVLTASVGAVTADRKMLLHSVWIQAAGLTVAIVGAGAFSVGLQLAGFFPSTLDISSLDLIGVRIAPNFVTIAIGLSAGAAAAFGLTTEGPTSLIGVMIAAALIPAAATVGIGAAWNEYRIAVGSLVLLLLTMILINAGAFVVLRRFYNLEQEEWLFSSRSFIGRLAVVGTALVLVVLVVLVGVASYQQIALERTINAETQDTFDEYDEAKLVTVRIQYSSGPFGSPETITVLASRTADGSDPPMIADDLNRRVTEATDRNVDVRVRFQEYQRADSDDPSESVTEPQLGRSLAVLQPK